MKIEIKQLLWERRREQYINNIRMVGVIRSPKSEHIKIEKHPMIDASIFSFHLCMPFHSKCFPTTQITHPKPQTDT